MLYPHVPLGRRTLSSLRATCAWSGRPSASRERLGLLRPGLMGAASRSVPASLSEVLEEPWLTSRLGGRTRLTAKDEDHWDEEDDDKEAFCDEMERIWSEFVDTVRGELLFWRRERDEFPNQQGTLELPCPQDTTLNITTCTNKLIRRSNII